MGGHAFDVNIQYVKMSFHHKLIYTFNKMLINIPVGVFQNLKRLQSSFGKISGQGVPHC